MFVVVVVITQSPLFCFCFVGGVFVPHPLENLNKEKQTKLKNNNAVQDSRAKQIRFWGSSNVIVMNCYRSARLFKSSNPYVWEMSGW